jgi:hypothetical protein
MLILLSLIPNIVIPQIYDVLPLVDEQIALKFMRLIVQNVKSHDKDT